MAYDRTIVVFSPDGRLLQVEYARQMVKNGSTSVGLKAKDAVILGGAKSSAPLAVKDAYKKVYEIDDHIAVVFSGSVSDTRSLVNMGRVKSQVNRITYGEPITVSSLAQYISDRKHLVTQYAGVRPYGVGMLIGGVNSEGPKLYETDPSGTMIEWMAQVIGKGAEKAKKVLSKEYREGMEVKAAVRLAQKVLQSGEKAAGSDDTEIAIIKEGGITKLTGSEVKKFGA
jgi:proteasome alpha subunit